MKAASNRRTSAVACLVFLFSVAAAAASKPVAEKPESWVGTWASSPQLAAATDMPQGIAFADVTLRQLVHVSVGGSRLRVRFSNAFGTTPLAISTAHIATALAKGSIVVDSDRELTFAGGPTVSIPPGAMMVSDPIDFKLPALSDLAVTVHIKQAPAAITSHPGSRTTSYLLPGNVVAQAEMGQAISIDRWYFLNGVDVAADSCAKSVAVLGDSIADGRGSTTNGNDRWPDNLARRLQQDKRTAKVGVLNEALGGNRLLRDGIGPNVLARLDRDVLSQTGVRWLMVAEGINDIGTQLRAKQTNEDWATAEDIIAAYRQIVLRAHAHGIKVYAATLLPFGGSLYDSADTEKERQQVNQWIRAGGAFDGVIDFDSRTRAEKSPSQLAAAVDGGDHLHPNAAGYKMMADGIDLGLFAEQSCASTH
jgi:lysophospholipase L1-like esterase